MTVDDGNISHTGAPPVACPLAAAAPTRASRLPARLVFAAFVVLLGVAYVLDWPRSLSLENLIALHTRFHGLLAEHRALALILFAGAYVAVGAFCVPGGALLTAVGGMAFGTWLGGLASLLGATTGATLLFLTARSACSQWVLERGGPLVARIRAGFQRDALNYMLFLRLVPAFPFWLVNIVSAALAVPLRTFVLGTALGIVPATFAFASAGAGLSSLVAQAKAEHAACLARHAEPAACPLSIPASALFTKELMVALVLLGVLALIPVIVRRWRRADADVR